MKKVIILLISIFSFLHAETMFITVKKAQVRSAPTFLGKVLVILNYTDEVEITGESGGWYIINSDRVKEGWLPVSSVTMDPLVLKKSDSNVSNDISHQEVSLAGKGFNSEMEAAFKDSLNLDYTWVDIMENEFNDYEAAIEFIGYN